MAFWKSETASGGSTKPKIQKVAELINPESQTPQSKIKTLVLTVFLKNQQ
jgi:hypothetical protein